MTEFDLTGFLASFFDEARTRLQSINEKLVQFEAGKLDDSGLTQLRRDAHTIKGAAQMLGVQDIAEASHLFEDVVEYLVARSGDDAQSMSQFLFDLHDALQRRLQYVDAKPHLDMQMKRAHFAELKAQLDGTTPEADSAPQARAPAQKKRRRKRRVPGNLIAAVMGSIEGSLQAEKSSSAETAEPGEAATKPAKTVETDIAGGNATVTRATETGSGETNATQADAAQVSPVESGAHERMAAEGEQVVSQASDSVAAPQPEAAIDFRPAADALEQQQRPQPSSGQFLRIDQMRLQRLSNQIIELGSDRYQEVLPQQQLQRVLQDMQQLKGSLEEPADARALQSWHAEFERQLRRLRQVSEAMQYQQKRSSAMLTDLRDQVFGLMLRPIGSVFSVFPRAVRDIAKRSGKKVQLLLAGESVEMDQLAAEALTEPLIHLINNAVAHGIESPAERKRCGKLVKGQITIASSQQGRDVHIVVSDDGKGMDIDLIRSTATQRGLISATEADEMDSSEILELIFHPGFSTQTEVNDLAGRGMGLSIVVDAIHELTGTIHVHSQAGQGTRFHLTIPASVAVQQIKQFRIGKQSFGVLASLVKQVVPMDRVEVKQGHGAYSNGYICFEGHRAPVIDLRRVLKQGASPAAIDMMIVEYLGGFLAVMIDEVLGEQEMMLREIDPYLKHYQPLGLMACSIKDDGSVLLLIDPNGLKEMWRTAPDTDLTARPEAAAFNGRMMLVDDSGIARRLEKALFESMGFTVDTAIGVQDMLGKIHLHDYDLLVTDLEMPETDGCALVQQLRGQEQYKTLPMLMIATRESEDEQQRALDAGVDAYLVKRCLKDDAGKLIETLNRLLGIDETVG